ncbi:MAG: peptidoglycan-associated lipoprotein [Verrucomicrobiaceae bacterium]|nr:peptidoglycan-associated lipoprotein [Verrucomicrobiaceae bacterium]
MTYKNLGLSLGVVLAMALAGCSSNKAADSANQNGANSGLGSNSSSTFDPSANGNGSNLAQNGRIVYFGYDQATLSSDGQSVLDSNISALKSGSQHIRLEGHADERGTREYNLALGERRANAVLQYLVANGVSKARIETISYGKERPADVGHDESAWSKNRRVEIVLN